MEQDHGNRSKDLANEKNIRDARKLYLYARAQGMNYVTQAMAVAALKDSVQRQILAPAPNGRGHFASSRPGQDLQVDLIDFSKNTSKRNEHRYAVVGADVFIRKVAIQPVTTKSAATVRGAIQGRAGGCGPSVSLAKRCLPSPLAVRTSGTSSCPSQCLL